MKSAKSATRSREDDAEVNSTEPGDLLWGVAAIAREIGRSRAQTYHLIKIGALDGCVRKLSYKTTAASRRKLRQLVAE